MKVTIAGSGYVGLVTAACLANKGETVTCVDVNEEKIAQLNAGRLPIYEEGLSELMQSSFGTHLFFSSDCSAAYCNSEVVFIAVGTPEKKDGSANLKHVNQVAEEIAKAANQDMVIVIKSTVPIGTNQRIRSIVNRFKDPNIRISVASNPEFLSQGSAIRDMLQAPRIVIGSEDTFAKTTLEQLYSSFDCPIVHMDCNSAEMVKYASNDFLALKISYINEIANLCEIVEANVEDVAHAMGLDPRIGDRFLKAGIGYGGSCFPKDTKALHWLANYHDYELKTIKAAIEVNENQKLKLIKKARKYYDSFEGLTVAILGLTFKPGTDDLREAPSLVNVPILLEEGARIQVYDPVGMKNFQSIFRETVCYSITPEAALKDADLCFVLTEWQEIRELTADIFVKQMQHPIILDGRNCLKKSCSKDNRLTIEQIGL